MMSHTQNRQRTLPRMQSERADSGSRAGATLPQLWPTLSAPSQMATTTLKDSRTTGTQEVKKVTETRRSRRVAAVLRNWRNKPSTGLTARHHLEVMTMKMMTKMLELERPRIRDNLKLKTQDQVAVLKKTTLTLMLDTLKHMNPRIPSTRLETRTPTTNLL